MGKTFRPAGLGRALGGRHEPVSWWLAAGQPPELFALVHSHHPQRREMCGGPTGDPQTTAHGLGLCDQHRQETTTCKSLRPVCYPTLPPKGLTGFLHLLALQVGVKAACNAGQPARCCQDDGFARRLKTSGHKKTAEGGFDILLTAHPLYKRRQLALPVLFA